MPTLITICGHDGGQQGPRGIYNLWQKNGAKAAHLNVVTYDTIPNDIMANATAVKHLALQHLSAGEDVYLSGYSMGGAVAALVAHELDNSESPPLSGLVLLNSQSEGLQAIRKLHTFIPVLFCHGEDDAYFPPWTMESTWENYQGPKKIVLIESMDHDLQFSSGRPVSQARLAQELLQEISEFFASENSCESNQKVRKTIAKPTVWDQIRKFFT